MLKCCVSCLPPGVSVDSAPPLLLSLLSNMPVVTLLIITFNFTMRHLVIDEIPPGSHLSHIPDLYAVNNDNHQEQPLPLPSDKESPPVHLGGGLPPVPSRLVKKIEEGQFVELAELLPERLSTYWENDDQSKSTKSKHKTVSNILEWVQCFSIYVAIISRKEPHRVVDLLAYQHLVIQAHQEYQGDCWLGYDRRFRQRAAANPSRSWSTIDPTLWSLAFSGRASSAICSHCFSTSHSSRDCELNSGSNPFNHSVTRPPFKMQSNSNQARRPLCFDWNESPAPGCPHPACRFDHICYYCARNTAVKDKSHKAIYCPHRASTNGPRPTLGTRH